jgi:short-subunit dehydrogenase
MHENAGYLRFNGLVFHLWYYFRLKTTAKFQPVIVITGCSSGIGMAVAELMQKQPNYRVVMTARHDSLPILNEKFKENDRVMIRALDVTSEADRKKLIEDVVQRWGSINILVNNAGIAYRSVFEHMTSESELHQMDTNYLGPAGLIRLILPVMRQQGRGKIINISSVSGMLAMPTMASYSASKYALEGMSEALWYEGRPFGINVSLIQPGFIHSKSFQRVYYTEASKPPGSFESDYGDYYANMEPFIHKLMDWSITNPPKIAKLVLKVIRTEDPPLWIPATIDAWAFYYLRRMVPRRLLLPLLFAALPKSRTWGKRFTRKREG